MTNQVTEYSKTEAALADLKTQLADVVFDCTTPKGLKEAKDSKMLLVKVRTGLEAIRVEIKAPALERCNLIDSEARRITAEIKKLEDPILKQIQLELDRQAEIKAAAETAAREEAEKWHRKLAAIHQRPLDFITSTPEEILAALEKARAAAETVPPMFPEDMQEEAAEAFHGAIAKMEEMYRVNLKAAENAKVAASVPVTSVDMVSGPDETFTGIVDKETGEITVKPAPVEMPTGGDMPNCREMHDKKTETGDPEAGMVTAALPPKWNDLRICAKAACEHYGQFKKPHESIVALQDAITAIESV